MKRLNPVLARSFGFAVISVAVALSSSGCNLFGGGDDDGGGGGVSLTDAELAELVLLAFDTHSSIIAAGIQAAGTTSGTYPVAGGCSAVVTIGSPVSASTECDSTTALSATTCGTASNITWNVGTRFVGGLISTGTATTFDLDVNGYVTGGFVGSDLVQVNCVLKHNFDNGDYNTYGILSLVGCESADNDTMRCTIGEVTLGCEQIKTLLDASLPDACVNAI